MQSTPGSERAKREEKRTQGGAQGTLIQSSCGRKDGSGRSLENHIQSLGVGRGKGGGRLAGSQGGEGFKKREVIRVICR